jgi:hypothetical protein
MRKRMRTVPMLCRLVVPGLGLLPMLAETAAASLQWSWRYEGAGISASGTLTTNDVANSAGYFQITAITGTRNGVTITRLQPTGTAIPGNEPYAVDNLLSASGQQLTGNGFGFALADGTFSNPFFAYAPTPPTYLEFFSAPQSSPAAHSELPGRFMAQITKPARANASGKAHLR